MSLLYTFSGFPLEINLGDSTEEISVNEMQVFLSIDKSLNKITDLDIIVDGSINYKINYLNNDCADGIYLKLPNYFLYKSEDKLVGNGKMAIVDSTSAWALPIARQFIKNPDFYIKEASLNNVPFYETLYLPNIKYRCTRILNTGNTQRVFWFSCYSKEELTKINYLS